MDMKYIYIPYEIQHISENLISKLSNKLNISVFFLFI